MKLHLTNWFQGMTWNEWLLLITLLLSVSWVKLAPLILLLFLVLGFIQGSYKRTFIKHFFNWKSGLFWASCFFCFHFVGLIWTSNYGFAWSDIGMKLSFILIPITFSICQIKSTITTWVMRFSLGLTVLVIIMLLFSVWRSFYYPEDNNWGYFFETEYSIFLHRSYWATYTALASAALLHVLFTKSAYRNLVYFSAWLLLSCSTFLTISKAGIIIWFILTTSTVVHWFISSKHYKTLVLSIAVVFGLTALILFTNNRISSRFKEIPKAMNAQDNERETSIESNEARLTMWTTSWEIIKDNWLFGVGTGDVKDALISKNVALGNLEIAEKKLNSHNQFLNTWVQLGIGGLFCLLMIFVATWNSTKSFYGAIFILAFGTTMLFESFIETQGGIVPFCLLLGLFQLNYSEKSDVPVT